MLSTVAFIRNEPIHFSQLKCDLFSLLPRPFIQYLVHSVHMNVCRFYRFVCICITVSTKQVSTVDQLNRVPIYHLTVLSRHSSRIYVYMKILGSPAGSVTCKVLMC